MKKIALIFLLLISPLIQGCDPNFFYKVNVDEVAIITQNGKIVGKPVKGGLHFKIPFLQEVHLIKAHRVQTVEVYLSGTPEITAKLFWNIQDPIAFFKATTNGDPEKTIEKIIRENIETDLRNLSKIKMLEISEAQISDPSYSNKETEKIIHNLQPHIEKFGIKTRILFRKKNA